jgi:biopolymer transport protein ExbB/TolQ
MNQQHGIVNTLLGLPIFQAEWVLYLLILLSFISVAVMVERWIFYKKHQVDSEAIRLELNKLLSVGDYGGAAAYLQKFDSLETNVVLFGLREYQKGPDSVEDLLVGAEAKEKLRYNKWLSFLATVGSNSPFIGLFGTVLGIIRAFGLGRGHGRGRRQRHGRHLRGLDRHRGRPLGRHPGGHRLQRLLRQSEDGDRQLGVALSHLVVGAQGPRNAAPRLGVN